jgi:hypothetical protein
MRDKINQLSLKIDGYFILIRRVGTKTSGESRKYAVSLNLDDSPDCLNPLNIGLVWNFNRPHCFKLHLKT